MKFILSGIFLLTLSASGAVKKKALDDLAGHRAKVMEMGARLSSLEKEIGAKNNLYLSSIDQIKQFELDIKLYRERLISLKEEVRVAQDENKKIIRSYLLESENITTEEWQRKVHLELLKQARQKLINRENELASFQSKVMEFDLRLEGLRKDEEELAVVIRELENRKKTVMEQYLAQVQSKKKLEALVQAKELKTKISEVKKEFLQVPIVESKPDRYFSRPLEDFLSFSSGPKGVTFKYQSVQPIKAVGEGKVVFAGDLASYGQVVLIDHGRDLRTVLLGKMNIKVKKNDEVQKGDVLAYTANDGKDAQNLYFEVRKKNTAQNTILWLDQSGVSKI